MLGIVNRRLGVAYEARHLRVGNGRRGSRTRRRVEIWQRLELGNDHGCFGEWMEVLPAPAAGESRAPRRIG